MGASILTRIGGRFIGGEVGGGVDVVEDAGVVDGEAAAEFLIIEPELGEAVGAIGCEDQGGDGGRYENGVTSTGIVLGNDGDFWPLKRPVGQCAEGGRGDFGVVAGVEDDGGASVEEAGGAEADADRFEHGAVGRAFGSVEGAIAEGAGDGFGFVAQHDDHLVTDRTDGVVGGADERLGAVGE